MKNSSILNEKELSRIYLVANTPSYLLRHYRADESVQALARSKTAFDLLSHAADIAKRRDRTLEEVVSAYAALVATTFKSPKETLGLSKAFSLEGLNWASDILSFAANQKTTTQQVRVTLGPPSPYSLV